MGKSFLNRKPGLAIPKTSGSKNLYNETRTGSDVDHSYCLNAAPYAFGAGIRRQVLPIYIVEESVGPRRIHSTCDFFTRLSLLSCLMAALVGRTLPAPFRLEGQKSIARSITTTMTPLVFRRHLNGEKPNHIESVLMNINLRSCGISAISLRVSFLA